jgi:hypothetical protein
LPRKSRSLADESSVSGKHLAHSHWGISSIHTQWGLGLILFCTPRVCTGSDHFNVFSIYHSPEAKNHCFSPTFICYICLLKL